MACGSCDGDADTACGCASGFVRVRYYFGQRIGVPEMTDATNYAVGKQRFANARLHGFGVLCGLRVTRVPETPAADEGAVVVQVSAGAALDPCGREVVVGGDHCVNAAAWFASDRDKAPYRDWKSGDVQPLWVAVRYRECPTDPQQAPRNSCDPGGCEFGRVVEGFELALVPKIDDILTPPPFSDPAAVRALAGPGMGAAVSAPCPAPNPRGWLVLARFVATVGEADGKTVVTRVGVPANDIPERVSLLSTQALQAVLLALAAGPPGSNPFATGPRFGAVAADSGTTLTIAVEGLTAPDKVAEPTFDPTALKLRKFDGAKWATVAASSAFAGGKVVVTVPPMAPGDRYRLVYAPPPETPLVDTAMRPVTPNPLVRQFRVRKDATTGVWTAADV